MLYLVVDDYDGGCETVCLVEGKDPADALASYRKVSATWANKLEKHRDKFKMTYPDLPAKAKLLGAAAYARWLKSQEFQDYTKQVEEYRAAHRKHMESFTQTLPDLKTFLKELGFRVVEFERRTT